MKRMKKLLAMLLTVTMTCALSVTPALARDGDGETSGSGSTTESGTTTGTTTTPATTTSGKYGNGKDAVTSIPFVKVLEAPEGSAVTNEDFTFTMTPASSEVATGQVDSYNVYPGVGTTQTVTISTNDGKVDKAAELEAYDTTGVAYTGAFDLTGLTFEKNKIGVYRYLVEETKGENSAEKSHLTLGGEKFIVDLYVDNDGKIVYAQATNRNTKDKAPIVFHNTLQFTSIKITKKVEGSLLEDTDKAKEFTFQMKIPAGGVALHLTEGAKFAYTKYNQDSSTTDGAIIVGGEIGNDDGWNTFTLKDGESIVFDKNIPIGMIFYVKENAADKFSISYTYECGNSKATVQGNPESYLTSTSSDNILTFINTREEVNTGIVLDIMPYIAVILIVAAAGVTTILAKRRMAK
jgi:hypothetical protein